MGTMKIHLSVLWALVVEAKRTFLIIRNLVCGRLAFLDAAGKEDYLASACLKISLKWAVVKHGYVG